MTKTPIEMATEVQQMGQDRLEGELAQAGIDPVSPEAVPYYASWTRADIALSAALLCCIANDMRELVKYAKLAVALLFLIGVGVAFGRLR